MQLVRASSRPSRFGQCFNFSHTVVRHFTQTTPPIPHIPIETEKPKGFFRNMFEYNAYSAASSTAFTVSALEITNHFTILGPYSVYPAVTFGLLYGIFFGTLRGSVTGAGNYLVKDRRVSNIVSKSLKEIGGEKIRLDDVTEEELAVVIQKLYARFPWTHQQTFIASIKRTVYFALLPNVEQVLTSLHREIQYNKQNNKKVGNFEQLTCGIINGVILAQVDKIDLILLIVSWLLLVVGSVGLFSVTYGAKKSLLWMGNKKDQIVQKTEQAKTKVSEMIPEDYIAEKRQQIQEISSKFPTRKQSDESEPKSKKGIWARVKERAGIKKEDSLDTEIPDEIEDDEITNTTSPDDSEKE